MSESTVAVTALRRLEKKQRAEGEVRLFGEGRKLPLGLWVRRLLSGRSRGHL
jgi:hypothetical protein